MSDLEFKELRRRPEELHPDLERCLVEEGERVLTLDHPLVFMLGVDPKHAAELNERYRWKIEALDQAFEDGDWRAYIRLHERQHRVDALIYIFDELDDGLYWELVAEMWIDSENIWQNQPEWQDLWNSGRPEKHVAMVREEREAFALLSDELGIYRGVRQSSHVTGLSWTLDREKAIWFARRFRGDCVVKAKVKKHDIHALFNRRGEQEVVTDRFQIIDIETFSEGSAR